METIVEYVDGCGHLELEIPVDIVDSCHHIGNCSDDVERALETPFIRQQFDRIPDEKLVKSLCEVWYDSEQIKKSDRHTNEMRALWIVCGNIWDNRD